MGVLFATTLLSESEDPNTCRSLRNILLDLSKTYRADIRFEKLIHNLMSPRIFMNAGVAGQLKSDDQATRDRKMLSLMDIALSAEVLLMLMKFKEDMALGKTAFISLGPNLSILF